MNVYDRWVLPPILDLAMRTSRLQKYRREVVAAAQGRVLEIGVGSGLNLPFYGRQVELVVGIDPSPRLLAMARRRAAAPVSVPRCCRRRRPRSRSRTEPSTPW
jgi:SAM-dependent methyltransferase